MEEGVLGLFGFAAAAEKKQSRDVSKSKHINDKSTTVHTTVEIEEDQDRTDLLEMCHQNIEVNDTRIAMVLCLFLYFIHV
jgi:hypothetical protein